MHLNKMIQHQFKMYTFVLSYCLFIFTKGCVKATFNSKDEVMHRNKAVSSLLEYKKSVQKV